MADFSYVLTRSNFIEWPEFTTTGNARYLRYILAVAVIGYMCVGDLCGMGEAGAAISAEKKRKGETTTVNCVGNLKSLWILVFAVEMLVAFTLQNYVKLVLLTTGGATAMWVWKHFGAAYWRETGRHLGTIGMKIGLRDFTAGSDPMEMRIAIVRWAVYLATATSVFSGNFSIMIHMLASFIVYIMPSEKVILLIFGSMTYHIGIIFMAFQNRAITGHIQEKEQMVDAEYAGQGENESAIEALQFAKALFRKIFPNKTVRKPMIMDDLIEPR